MFDWPSVLLARNVGTFTSIFFITANSSAHSLCSEILIFFYLDLKPLDYALHIVSVTWFLFCISIVLLTENVIRDLCCDVLQGPNHTHSGDGHDKLMGFMNCTFLLTGYGLRYVLYRRGSRILKSGVNFCNNVIEPKPGWGVWGLCISMIDFRWIINIFEF